MGGGVGATAAGAGGGTLGAVGCSAVAGRASVSIFLTFLVPFFSDLGDSVFFDGRARSSSSCAKSTRLVAAIRLTIKNVKTKRRII